MAKQTSASSPAPGAGEARLADLAYAAAMLKNTPRSGFAFLGTGHESVAEHSFGAAFLSYILARKAGADAAKTVLLCLVHDLPEAATGDFNYVNHRYDQADAAKALADMCAGTPMAAEIMALSEEFEARNSKEAALANDADQLDLICSLRKELAKGNEFAAEWLKSAVQRISTQAGRELCAALMATSPHAWWYEQVDQSWWIDRTES